VVHGGISHVYDKEHSYPMSNADIGMILGRLGFWLLEGRMTGEPALAKFSLTTKLAMIDSSIEEWIAGENLEKYPDDLSHSEEDRATIILYLRLFIVR